MVPLFFSNSMMMISVYRPETVDVANGKKLPMFIRFSSAGVSSPVPGDLLSCSSNLNQTP